jgi:hypothetical protein
MKHLSNGVIKASDSSWMLLLENHWIFFDKLGLFLLILGLVKENFQFCVFLLEFKVIVLKS